MNLKIRRPTVVALTLSFPIISRPDTFRRGCCVEILESRLDGRALSAFAPFTIGALSSVGGIGSALALTSAFFLAGAVLILFLPDTRGQPLED